MLASFATTLWTLPFWVDTFRFADARTGVVGWLAEFSHSRICILVGFCIFCGFGDVLEKSNQNFRAGGLQLG